MQVVNANKGVKSLEVSTDGGSSWKATTRQPYNFFENPSGFGTATVDVKVTSVDGDVVIVKNVGVSSGASTTGTSNFGSSSAAPVVSEKAVSSATSTSTPAATQDPTPLPEIVTLIPDATTPPAPIAPVTTTTPIPGANFVETGVAPTTVAAIPTPAPVVLPSTSSTKTKKPCTKSHSTILPSAIPVEASTTLTASVSKSSLAAGLTTSSSVGTTSAYAAPSGIITSTVSGKSNSTIAPIPAATQAPQIPFSSASRAAVSIGGIVAACVAAFALL